MKIDSSYKNVGSSTADVKTRLARTATAQTSGASSSVELSPMASQLQQLESSIADAPAVDAAKVSELKQAIAEGRFEHALSLISQASLDGLISADAAKQLTDQLKAAEEAKRISFLQDQLLQLREKVINGRVIEHKPIADASAARVEEQPMRMISHG